jgi:hypothetical protein
MAEQDFAFLLTELAGYLELPVSGQRKLAEFWANVLEPHAGAIGIYQRKDFERFWEGAPIGSPRELSQVARYGLARLILVQAVTRSLTAGDYAHAAQAYSQARLWAQAGHYAEGFPKDFPSVEIVPVAHHGSGPRRAIGFKVAETVYGEEEAQTAVVLKTISDTLKSAAMELASSNNNIEQLLASMETPKKKIQKRKTKKRKKVTEISADERAG